MDKYNSRNKTLGLAQAGNQIAQALAMKGGAKIGDGSETIRALKADNVAPIKQLQDEDASAMVDAGSDVSKMYREQAYALLKKLNPGKDFSGQLENMSAAQLQKLPGLKNALGGNTGKVNNRYVTIQEPDGSLRSKIFNMETGELVKDLGAAGYAYGYQKDPLTGKPMALNKSLPNAAPITPGGRGTEAQAQNPETGEAQTVKFSDLQKVSPEQSKEFGKLREEMMKDMKESREVATSVTNLASKLVPGPNGNIDSGLLGTVQTQAAKMSGQKGVLTDQDLVKFAGAGGVPAKLQRIVDGSLFGEMSDEDIKFFKRFSQLMGKSLDSDIANRAQYFTEIGRQNIEGQFPGITDDNIKELLGVSKIAPIVQGKEKTKDPNIVTIVGPSGKPAQMTRENAKKYLSKPGYSEVK